MARVCQWERPCVICCHSFVCTTIAMETRRVAPAVPPKPRRLPGSHSHSHSNSHSHSQSHLQSQSQSQPQPQPQSQPQPQPQPLVPQSCSVGAAQEPSYSSRLSQPPHAHPPLYSNERVYSNVGVPPPHPPPPGATGQAPTGPLPPAPASAPISSLLTAAPPSPVSSSYSELRRAADRPDIGGYGSSASSASAYESLYEPINPRPPSQLSAASAYSIYSGYGRTVTAPPGGPPLDPPKEAEVDALTDYLVRSMGEPRDSDVFGVCVKCGERVLGETSGCTAMDRVYHIRCFACCVCAINLQGKPFYPLDGKPYCEEDYLNTLEKCSVCTKPILDRILRATGKPYHPACFTCVVCGKSLDGIPFTVDATNRIHCIEDFHKKFAPRCCVCKHPIMPEPGLEETVRVVALDRSFHITCYKCEDCGLVLSSESEGRGCYPLDDHVLCKSCNAKRVQALTNHMTTEL